MKADQKTEAAVMAVVNGWLESYATRDMGALLGLFAPDPDVIILGTGADEIRTGLDEIRAQAVRDWSQSEALSFEWEWHSASAAGPVAWLVGAVAMHVTIGGQDVRMPGARMTVVLERRGDRWLIVHSHASLPAAGQAEGESFPAEAP